MLATVGIVIQYITLQTQAPSQVAVKCQPD